MREKPGLLIVEDEWLIAEYLREVLEAEGYEIRACATSVSEALLLIERVPLDAALVDFRLKGATSAAVAAALEARAVPFVFMTGLDILDLPAQFQNRPALTKPIETARLITVLGGLTKRI